MSNDGAQILYTIFLLIGIDVGGERAKIWTFENWASP